MSNLTTATANRQAAGILVDNAQQGYMLALSTADRATIAAREAAYIELRADYQAAVLAEAREIVARPDVCYPEDVARAQDRLRAAAREAI